MTDDRYFENPEIAISAVFRPMAKKFGTVTYLAPMNSNMSRHTLCCAYYFTLLLKIFTV